MAVRKYKPTTPARRGMSVSDFATVTTDKPLKALAKPNPKKAGRNAHGRITTRHQGGGHKQKYRVIDFRREKDGVPAKVAEIEYDPNRSARIARLHYLDGEKRYILAPAGVNVGDVLESGEKADIRPGNALPLRNIPVGTGCTRSSCAPAAAPRWAAPRASKVQLLGEGGQDGRAAAALRRDPAGAGGLPRHRRGRSATPSTTSSTSARPAARRWKGVRPTVRGVVMNPVDHPHGGGEGRTSGGRHPTNPNGKPEGRTRDKNKTSNAMIIRRRGKRRR